MTTYSRERVTFHVLIRIGEPLQIRKERKAQFYHLIHSNPGGQITSMLYYLRQPVDLGGVFKF